MIIINAIYKTNRYRLPLLIITDVNALENLFYVVFCFIAAENNEDYL